MWWILIGLTRREQILCALCVRNFLAFDMVLCCSCATLPSHGFRPFDLTICIWQRSNWWTHWFPLWLECLLAASRIVIRKSGYDFLHRLLPLVEQSHLLLHRTIQALDGAILLESSRFIFQNFILQCFIEAFYSFQLFRHAFIILTELLEQLWNLFVLLWTILLCLFKFGIQLLILIFQKIDIFFEELHIFLHLLNLFLILIYLFLHVPGLCIIKRNPKLLQLD